METVKSLRQKGYRIKVLHSRREAWDEENGVIDRRYHEKGGSTEVRIFSDSNKWITTGNSVCSIKDNYDRKQGVRIALGRALDKIPWTF